MNRRVFGLALLAATVAATARAQPLALSEAERAVIAAALGLAPQVAVELPDEALAARLLAFARREAGQIARPAQIDPLWSLSPPLRDLPSELSAARSRGDLAGWIAGLGPPSDAYRALRAARGQYALAAAGDWPVIGPGPPLRAGDRSSLTGVLRSRLRAEGFGVLAEPATDPDVVDEPLVTAVREFQTTHALADDGVVGPATREALNVTAAQRLAQIDANLERMRWLPRNLPADRIEVDTGQQEAVLWREGREALRMRAIVGSPLHPTPMFVSVVDAVIFNPPWNVPASIARDELLPAEARRPGLLASLGITWVDGHLQQRPGPGNSLGQVKFDVHSPFGVYLHDTPGKGLFANPVRAFSHGCMRLQDAPALAAALLGPQGGSPATVAAAIAAGATRRLALRRAVPLFVTHGTALARPDGGVSFRPDIYGWDRRLAAALAAVDPGQGQAAVEGQGRNHG